MLYHRYIIIIIPSYNKYKKDDKKLLSYQFFIKIRKSEL